MDDGYSEISSDGGEDKLYSQVLNYLFISYVTSHEFMSQAWKELSGGLFKDGSDL